MIDGLFFSAMPSAVPLTLAGIGALISELSGALGIFIDGFMNAGAFFSWVFALWTGSILDGVLMSSILAALIGWALAVYVRISGANPFVAGIALNLGVSGLTSALSSIWFGTKGVLRSETLGAAAPVNIPLIKDVPFAGSVISGNSPFVYATVIITLLCAYVIGKTKLGYQLRASGLAPEACVERGLRPWRYKEGAWAAAAFLAALAGAALTFRIGAYAPGAVAGRGWLALAAVYLGFRRVWGVAAAAIIFSAIERLSLGTQSISGLPLTALLGLPSALALILYSLSSFFNKTRRSHTGSHGGTKKFN